MRRISGAWLRHLPSFPPGKTWLAGGLLAAMLSCTCGEEAKAAPVEEVRVSVASTAGTIPPSVEKRIAASVGAIGNRVLVGKEESLFQLDPDKYNRVLADIVNRVVVGYVVSGIDVSYGAVTEISLALQPVGRTVQQVETTIDYGNLSPEAAALVKKDTAGIEQHMSDLLLGLPVDSVGWADSVSQSAGRELLSRALPEFEAGFDVSSGERTKVRIYLVPQGNIVRRSVLTFRETTVPRLLLYRAAEETERAMRGLEGLPTAFVRRHSRDIEEEMDRILRNDSFIRRYEIAIRSSFIAGSQSELKVDALTDHWVIRGEAWIDAGRDGSRSTAVGGMLGHYAGKNDLIFGEARFYPGPVDWNLYGGWMHRFGREYTLGYKYDFTDKSGHVLAGKTFGERWAFRYDRDLAEKENEYGLSYRLHNYMTVEYVYNDEEGKWLRLIANL